MMILLFRNQPGRIVVTASEMAVVPVTSYSILFTNEMTKTPILIEGLTDTSAYPERYNAFDIDTSVFDDADNGFYDYQITDQDGSVLEVGKMKLVGETVNPVEYQSTPIEYDTYGQ